MAKYALLIGGSEYGEGLAPLAAAPKDVAALGRILQDRDLGQFDQVSTLLNPDPQALREAVEGLFYKARKGDLALLFFSGHGIKDDRNRLYFATRLTRKTPQGTLVKSTAVPASFIHDQMADCRSQRQVVILDCCFSGAFADGMTAKDDGGVDLRTALGGRGRVVLTSTAATQYAFEQGVLSLYTQHLVAGIETGQADADGDGQVAIDELHDYICRQLEAAAAPMQPKIYAFDQGFKIHLAKAPQTSQRQPQTSLGHPSAPAAPAAIPATAALEPISFTTAWVHWSPAGLFGLGDRRLQVEWRSQQAEGLSLDIGGVALTLIRIPAGRFLMGGADPHADWHPGDTGLGSRGPVHRVTLRPFFLSQTLITQAQWQAVAAHRPVAGPLSSPISGPSDLPVSHVTWWEAEEFCQRLSRHLGGHCRLPSEAEWEYACRAGTKAPFSVGEALTPEVANYSSHGPTAVAQFAANEFGLYDMHGNLWEWCRDRWHETYVGAPNDGAAWDNTEDNRDGRFCDRRVIRGGSWMDPAQSCQSDCRMGLLAQTRSHDLGFRIAFDL